MLKNAVVGPFDVFKYGLTLLGNLVLVTLVISCIGYFIVYPDYTDDTSTGYGLMLGSFFGILIALTGALQALVYTIGRAVSIGQYGDLTSNESINYGKSWVVAMKIVIGIAVPLLIGSALVALGVFAAVKDKEVVDGVKPIWTLLAGSIFLIPLILGTIPYLVEKVVEENL